MAIEENCELVGFMAPFKINTKDKKIVSVTFMHTEQREDGSWFEDEEQLTTLKANFVISAFGSGLYDENGITL